MSLNTLDYKSSKLYNNSTAKAALMLYAHNPDLNFQSFAYEDDATPSHTENNAYIAAETGTIFGISATKGQIIRDTGSTFIAENFVLYETIDKQQRYNPKHFFALHKTDTNDVSSSLSNNRGAAMIEASTYTGRVAEYFAGSKARLYYLFKDGWNGSSYPHYIDYYQYDDDTWGTPYNFVNLNYTNDSHDLSCLCITESGYILLLTTHRTESRFKIYKSDNVEDISAFTDKTPGAWSFGGNLDYPVMEKCNGLIIGGARGPDQHRRTIIYSSDEGENWSENTLFEHSDSDYWAYGGMARCSSNDGVFQFITLLNHKTGSGSSTYSNVAKIAVLWSDDGVTWGNMEYYATKKKTGFSKNISSEGAITDTELYSNCMIIDDDWTTGDEDSGHPNNQIKEGFVADNGELVVISWDGTRNQDQGILNYDNVRVSIYSNENLAWNHTLIPDADFDTGIEGGHIRAYPSGFDSNVFDLIFRQSDGSNNQWFRYKYNNGEIHKIEELTSFSDDCGNLNDCPFFLETMGTVLLTCDSDTSDGNITFIKFDKNMR